MAMWQHGLDNLAIWTWQFGKEVESTWQNSQI